MCISLYSLWRSLDILAKSWWNPWTRDRRHNRSSVARIRSASGWVSASLQGASWEFLLPEAGPFWRLIVRCIVRCIYSILYLRSCSTVFVNIWWYLWACCFWGVKSFILPKAVTSHFELVHLGLDQFRHEQRELVGGDMHPAIRGPGADFPPQLCFVLPDAGNKSLCGWVWGDCFCMFFKRNSPWYFSISIWTNINCKFPELIRRTCKGSKMFKYFKIKNGWTWNDKHDWYIQDAHGCEQVSTGRIHSTAMIFWADTRWILTEWKGWFNWVVVFVSPSIGPDAHCSLCSMLTSALNFNDDLDPLFQAISMYNIVRPLFCQFRKGWPISGGQCLRSLVFCLKQAENFHLKHRLTGSYRWIHW